MNKKSAVDRNIGAGDVGLFIGCQKGDSGGYLFRFGHAPQRNT